MLEKIGNQTPIIIITRSPNQFRKCKKSIEIKPIDKNKGSVVIFDDFLGARNSSQKNDFFTRGRHEHSDVCYFSQSSFGLPRQSIRINSDRLILFKQTLRDVESMYKDIGVYDIKYDEFKEMCRKARSESINYSRIEIGRDKKEGKYRNFNENKNTYIECIPEKEVF